MQIFVRVCSPFVILRDTCRVRAGCFRIYIIPSTLSYFGFIHSHWYIAFLHSHITFFMLFLPILVVCMPFFIVFLPFHERQLVFYFAGTSQTLTSLFFCTFIQVGFHLKPPHLYIFMFFVFSLFTFSLIFTHFYSTHYTIHLIIHFYVRWLRLHPHLVSVISFSDYQVVCASAFPRSTFPVQYSLFTLPTICLHHCFGLSSQFLLLLFSLCYSSSVLTSCCAVTCSWSFIVSLPILCSYGHCWCW